jgi:hypothetical protein
MSVGDLMEGEFRVFMLLVLTFPLPLYVDSEGW